MIVDKSNGYNLINKSFLSLECNGEGNNTQQFKNKNFIHKGQLLSPEQLDNSAPGPSFNSFKQNPIYS